MEGSQPANVVESAASPLEELDDAAIMPGAAAAATMKAQVPTATREQRREDRIVTHRTRS